MFGKSLIIKFADALEAKATKFTDIANATAGPQRESLIVVAVTLRAIVETIREVAES